MRLQSILSVLIPVAACSGPDAGPQPGQVPPLEIMGRLADPAINEASGLARSQRDDSVFWLVNDSAPPILFAVGPDGSARGRVRLVDAGVRDWEDIESFALDGEPYLLVADAGDNLARRDHVSLYIVREPDAGAEAARTEWRIDFRYADGPRDAEAFAVDPANGIVYVVTKRDIPARLYSLPLRPEPGATVTARFLGTLDKLPQPTRADVEAAARKRDWFWQPSGMSFAASGDAALVVTYDSVYRYARSGDAGWTEVLLAPPEARYAHGMYEPESVTFDAGGTYAYLTTEGQHAAFARIRLQELK